MKDRIVQHFVVFLYLKLSFTIHWLNTMSFLLNLGFALEYKPASLKKLSLNPKVIYFYFIPKS